MRILLLNQFFWPDSSATSQLLTDVARALAAAGHEVTAICGSSEYAQPDAGVDPPPVTVRRIGEHRFGRSASARVASYASFLISGTLQTLRTQKPDVVISLTTPPGLAYVGWLAQALRRARHVIWEMDVYPDIAGDVGMLRRNSAVYRVLDMVLNFPRKRADTVITLGECMKQRLLRKHVSEERIVICHNWAEGVYPLPMIEDGCVRVLYSGNFGMAHDSGTIEQVIAATANDSRFQYVFAGGGCKKAKLLARCNEAGIRNVRFRPYCARAQLADRLAEGHLGLVTQEAAASGSVVPSKVYALMAAGRAVLFIGPHSATPARLIREHGCGWHFDCGDARGVLTLLETLSTDLKPARVAGQRGQAAFAQSYDVQAGVGRILCALGVVSADDCTGAALARATS